MAEWTHLMCDPCWKEYSPDREPHRIVDDDTTPHPCCFCSKPTTSGIYVRHDPQDDTLKCAGFHPPP